MFKEISEQQSAESYPATEEERDTLISQVLDLIHSEQTSDTLVQFMKTAGESPVEPIAKMASQITSKVITSIEQQTNRDVTGDTELAVLSMAVEELSTIATNFGVNFSPEMVQNSIQIGAQMFNQLMQGTKEGQRSQQQPPQNPSALGGLA